MWVVTVEWAPDELGGDCAVSASVVLGDKECQTFRHQLNTGAIQGAADQAAREVQEQRGSHYGL